MKSNHSKESHKQKKAFKIKAHRPALQMAQTHCKVFDEHLKELRAQTEEITEYKRAGITQSSCESCWPPQDILEIERTKEIKQTWVMTDWYKHQVKINKEFDKEWAALHKEFNDDKKQLSGKLASQYFLDKALTFKQFKENYDEQLEIIEDAYDVKLSEI